MQEPFALDRDNEIVLQRDFRLAVDCAEHLACQIEHIAIVSRARESAAKAHPVGVEIGLVVAQFKHLARAIGEHRWPIIAKPR